MSIVTSLKNKLIGDKTFYKKVLLIALPMIGQNAITSFVSFLDNIMVGKIGTEQMSGVAIVNQLVFACNKVNLLVSVQNRCHAIAVPVYINYLATFRKRVNRRKINIGTACVFSYILRRCAIGRFLVPEHCIM